MRPCRPPSRRPSCAASGAGGANDAGAGFAAARPGAPPAPAGGAWPGAPAWRRAAAAMRASAFAAVLGAGRRAARLGLAGAGLALLLAGCAHPPATPPAAPASLGEAWQAPWPHGARRESLVRWWAQFGDPVLVELVEDAQAASPSLATARARIARAQAALTAAEGQAGPQLELAGSLRRSRSTPAGAFGGALPGGAGGAAFGLGPSTSGSLGLQASWELDAAGGPAAARQGQAARLRGAQAGWHDARVSLAAEVARAYLGLRACEALAAQARADADSREASARLAGEAMRAGFTAPADLRLAQAGAAQARAQARAQEAQCEAQLKGLVELSDRPEPALRARLAAGAGQLPEAPPLAPAVLPAALLGQRPDLAAASAEVEAAAAERLSARADEGLRVALSGSLSAASLRAASVSAAGRVWSIGPVSLSLPLFDGGRRRAATAAADAAYDDAVVQLQGALRRALREVETALVELDATAARGREVEAAAAGFEAALAATEARRRSGLASQLDLEAARRQALQAQGERVALRRDRALAWIGLYRSLGGGWQPDDPVPPRAPRDPGARGAHPMPLPRS